MRERTLKARMRKFADQAISDISTRTERPALAWWLSFAGDDGFHGAVILHAESFTTALMEANLRGMNPHGECQGMEIPAQMAAKIPDH